MRLKTEFDHRASFARWGKSRIKRILNNGFYPFVPSVVSSVSGCFVVGCGHSGTTLVASRLGRLKGAFLVGAESDIFNPEHGLYSSWLRINDMFRMAEESGASCLIEKTPKHVHSYKNISRIVPHAKFVVITRNPLDNCASLYKRFGSLEYAIERYMMDNEAAVDLLKNHNNAIRVRYEDVVEDPGETLAAVAEFLQLEWRDAVIMPGATSYDDWTQKGNMALRQRQVAEPIIDKNGAWRSAISIEEKERIKRRLYRIGVEVGYSGWLQV